MFRDYHGGPHDVAMDEIKFMLEANASNYSAICIRTVNAKTHPTGEWIHQLTVIRPAVGDEGPVKEGSRRYPHAQLLEQWIEPDELIPYLEAMARDEAMVDGDRLALERNGTFTSEPAVYAGPNDYSLYPGRLYQTNGRSDQTVLPDPLVSPGLPYYPGLHEALCEWTGIPLHRSTDSRTGRVLIFMSECRARILNLVRQETVIEVALSLSPTAPADLCLIGGWKEDGRWNRFEKPARYGEPKVQLHVPPSAEELNFHLLGGDGRWYDFHREDRHNCIGQERVLGSASLRTRDSEGVEKALEEGEGQKVEFKPFIEPGHAKEDEVIRTVMAFANTDGGTIYYGVSDTCELIGSDQDLCKAFPGRGGDLDKAIDEYIGHLKKRLADELTWCPVGTPDKVLVHGHRVLVINVPEGDERVCARVNEGLVWVRRSASNRKGDLLIDLPRIAQRRYRGAGHPFRE